MKELLKSVLSRLRLLETARAIAYWFTRFDPNSVHPRRVFIRFYSQFIKKGDLCFDIGANIGSRTLLFLEIGADVVCVEPQQTCLNSLCKQFGNNRHVKIVPKGIADKEGLMKLSICETNTSISTMSEKFKDRAAALKREGYLWTRSEEVYVTTLDLLIQEYGMPDFCKIDIEGFEETAFTGLTKPIPLVAFEFLAVFYDEMKICVRRLLSIGNYRFNFVVGDPPSGEGFLLPQWSGPEELYKKLDSLIAEEPQILCNIYARLF